MNNRDILKQYVDIGQPIGKYQFNKLDNNLMNTYLRKRMIAVNQQDDDEGLNRYELFGAPDNFKDLFVKDMLKKMEGYFKICEKSYSEDFTNFKYGDVNPIVSKLFRFGETSSKSDYYMFKFLENDKFKHYLNIITIQKLLGRTKNTQKVLAMMGEIGERFKNSLTDEQIKQDIAYSNDPNGYAMTYGPEWVKRFRELTLRDIAYMVIHSINPMGILELCGDECMSEFQDDNLLRHGLNNSNKPDLFNDVLTKYGIDFEGKDQY